jgi:hypothetical protein
MDVVSGQLRTMGDSFADHCCARTDTNLAATQYLKFTLSDPGSGSNFPQAYLRYTNTSSPYYVLTFTASGGVVEWQRLASIGGASETVQSADAGVANGYRTWGITIDGTGTGTVIRCWTGVTADAPDSVTSWDGDTTPEITFDNNPTVPVDSGPFVGVGGATSIAQGIRFDNVFGGDFGGGAPPAAVRRSRMTMMGVS